MTAFRRLADGRTHTVEQHRTALPGVDAMTLVTDHVFPRHSHDQFGIGVMTTGAQRSWSCIGQVDSEAGDVIMVNPGEMHDGAPIGGQPRGWRMLYFDPILVAREIEEEQQSVIVLPAVRDPALAQVFTRLFVAVCHPAPDRLAIEENLLRSLMRALQRHATRHSEKPARLSPGVAAARRRLDAAPELPTTLAELASLSGVSRYQLLRGFAREVGTTPHSYLMQRRVILARRLVSQKRSSLAEAAAAAGFADQSHMTRVFVRQFGITPARYRAAVSL